MFRFLFGLALGAAMGFVAYIGGSLYPAPPALLERIHAQSVAERIQNNLQSLDWQQLQSLRGSMGDERFNALAQRATNIATAAGQAIAIEHVSDEEDRKSVV